MNNRDLVHQWANQIGNKGRGSHLFFEGTKLYSYGYHYLLGNVFPAQGIALINSHGYSSTTAKHTNYARAAFSVRWSIIDVPNPAAETMTDHQANMSYLVEQINRILAALKTARVNTGNLLLELEACRDNAKLYIRGFKIKGGKLPGLTAKQKAEYTVKAQEYKSRAEAQAIAKAARLAAQEAQALEEWRKGLNNQTFWHSAIALRLSNDKKFIETSKGARVGLRVARELYKRFKAGENLTGQTINGYPIDSVTAEIIAIGCHDIPVNEIKALLN